MSGRSLANRLMAAMSIVVLAAVGVVVGALAAGYRPVVILTGSMGETAPPGSLLVAAPVDGDSIEPGAILIMRRPGAATVTHRVIEVELGGTGLDGSGANGSGSAGAGRFAITKGDANEAPDAAPYPLDGRQLVGRWVVPGLGRWILTVFKPGVVLVLVGLATVVMAAGALRRIWAPPLEPHQDPGPTSEPQAKPDTTEGATQRPDRRWRGLAILVVPLVILTSAGVAWALATANEPVTANVFGASDCFDPELGSVQNGQTVHAANGTINVPITPVDPTSAFVVASVRSNSGEPADSMLTVELGGGGTTVDLSRATDAGSPPPVTVDWSVVAYDCGITVQRGTVAGDGTAQLDVAITAVDPASSFVLVSAAPESTDTAYGANDVFVGELADATTVRIRTTGSAFGPGRTFAWQVVEFDDGADAAVQSVTANLGLGTASATLTLSTPVDPDSTFLVASVASASTGPDIGERLVRAHLVDATTVAVDRSVAGDPVEVVVQVVDLRDGSTVRHGTVDLAAAQPSATVTVAPVDPTRSTAFATVAQPGVAAGGMTDHVADDVIGEASATFTVTDPTSVAVTREATASNASFGWQLVEWAGPGWWDPAYDFRQRIDVDTTTTAAPDAYTVPLTFDHAALVAAGLSQADGDDIRVLRWDGAAWTELDRVLEDGSSWDQVTTTLWFRTTDPIAAQTTDTYWLHLGNPSASAPPADPEAVFLLTEDFESGTLGDFEDRTGGIGWYQALPWTRRLPVTVGAGTVSAALSDFPLLVSLTSADLAANALADGSDIRFTAADGSTPLAHEIERYDPGTGTLVAWVNVPTVTSAAAATVYLYYGAPDAPDQQVVREAWPTGIEAAWHLGRDPSGPAPQLDDSTAHNHDGLSAGSMTAGDLVAGLVGRAVHFDGVDDHLRADSFDVGGTTALSLSAWVNLDAHTTDARVVNKATDINNRVFALAIRNDGTLRGRLSLGGSTAELSGGTVGTGAWHHVAMTWDGATQRLYIDATEVAAQPAAGPIDTDASMPVTIGDLVGGSRALQGVIDEVRVETVARTAAWLDAVEANQRNPGTFHTVGGVETGSWFGQGTWSARKPIGVDSDLVPSDQIDYPLALQFTDAELAAGATAAGHDLVFTAADGVTRLDHVVESWDQGTGTVAAWVRVPLLSSSVDTGLFLYYGNPTAVSQNDPAAVFGPDADLISTGTP